MVTAKKLRKYFQDHPIIVKANYPIKQILKKPDLEDRMVAWVIELSKYDITYLPRNSIKSQVLVGFLIELSSPTTRKYHSSGSYQWTVRLTSRVVEHE